MSKTPSKQTPGKSQESDEKGTLSRYIKDDELIKVLTKKGVTRLFPIQYSTFDVIHKGEDVVAKDRTGSGKTLAFSLPVIARMRELKKFKGKHVPRYLIVLPTRELALQVKDQITSLKVRDENDFTVTAIYGGAGISEQLDAIQKGTDIIVGTPGRLLDFLDRGAIKLQELQAICLDEADEMLKIGFKQDIQKIFQHITKAKKQKVQCLLFSATIPEWIWEISDLYQSKNRHFIDMMKDSALRTSKTVQHYYLLTSKYDKQTYIPSLLKYFLKDKKDPKLIIFCQTKRQVNRIGSETQIPLSIKTLHGDIKQYDRQKVFRSFKQGTTSCLIATNVAARGLDFPQIDLIIQMQPPPNVDSYIHRSGRTGRAGRSGMCVTMCCGGKEEEGLRRIQEETGVVMKRVNQGELGSNNTGNRNDGDSSKDRDYNRNDSNRDYNRNDSRNDDRYSNNNNNNDRGYNNDRNGGYNNNNNNDRYDDRYNDRRNSYGKNDRNYNNNRDRDNSSYKGNCNGGYYNSNDGGNRNGNRDNNNYRDNRGDNNYNNSYDRKDYNNNNGNGRPDRNFSSNNGNNNNNKDEGKKVRETQNFDY